MARPPEPPDFHLDTNLRTLDRHHVEYLLVGGNATTAHGATRLTKDFDCLPKSTEDNLNRLAAALKQMGARLRGEGLDDEVSKQLPLHLDAEWLERMEIATFRTDAGDFDVLRELPARDGTRLHYDDLIGRAERRSFRGVAVTIADLKTSSRRRSGLTAPRTVRPCRSCTSCGTMSLTSTSNSHHAPTRRRTNRRLWDVDLLCRSGRRSGSELASRVDDLVDN